MKISELYLLKTIKRKEKEKGTVLIQEKIFKIPFNPNVDILWKRALAKAIDSFLATVILVSFYKLGLLSTNETYIIIPILMFLFLIISLTEPWIGSTPGKLILGLEVVNDNCQKLSFSFSIIKNFYGYFLIIISLGRAHTFIEFYNHWQAKKNFYVIRKKDKVFIRQLMEGKNFSTQYPKNY